MKRFVVDEFIHAATEQEDKVISEVDSELCKSI